MKKILIIMLSIITINLFSSNDSINNRVKYLEDRINNTNDKIENIKQGQLNYQIEKDLLKETYSNNFDRINTVITLILGIVGILAFFGIKDINAIKKEYQNELENLRVVKNEFQIKSTSFEMEKNKFELEIKDIVKQNDEQNNKIKVLELKEKIKKLLDDNQPYEALQYCNIGLEIVPDDISFLNSKAMICARLNQFQESKKCFKQALDIDPTNIFLIGNYTESLYFLNEISEAKTLIENNKKYFEEKEDGKLLHFLGILEKYHTVNEDEFKKNIIPYLDFNNLDATNKYFKTWSLTDAQFFAHFQDDSDKKIILKNIIWYLDGQLSAKVVAERLLIPLV